jgi:hypothetical protein
LVLTPSAVGAGAGAPLGAIPFAFCWFSRKTGSVPIAVRLSFFSEPRDDVAGKMVSQNDPGLRIVARTADAVTVTISILFRYQTKKIIFAISQITYVANATPVVKDNIRPF